MGPLVSAEQRETVSSYVDGNVAYQGNTPGGPGFWFPPTVLAPISNDERAAREEIFGPVAVVIPFEDEGDAIRLANDTPYGLAAYFYSRDIGRVWRVGEGLDYGIVGANTGFVSTEVAPFGGMKESGIGREGSKYGIEDWLEIKYIAMGGIDA
jgi:succinate-semialdehyde dehydrogenase / glutarate-semialdehyde dehydrogenase